MEELAVYGEGQYLDPLVGKSIDILDRTDEVVLVFPPWWYDFPAIMKGFFDKVMLDGSAFYKDDTGVHALRNIGRTLIITTASASTDSLIADLGGTINKMMIDTIFKAIGLNGAQWVNMGSIGNCTAPEREDFLSRISMPVSIKFRLAGSGVETGGCPPVLGYLRDSRSISRIASMTSWGASR